MNIEVQERDGMRVLWDVPIRASDGLLLRADVFLPEPEGRYPAILTYGPYAKGLSFQEGYPTAWERMISDHPDIATRTSNLYQNWETINPEEWVPDGYACIRVDSRGTGRSPGEMDHHSPREIQDLYECIDWIAEQGWSDGKVGLNGISYYATNQWRVAALRPPHLTAILAWEGYSDRYREAVRHGGILTSFTRDWQEMQVRRVQHGIGENGPRSPVTGEYICGPDTLSEDVLAASRVDIWSELKARELIDDYYLARIPDLDQIDIPLLSAANWGGNGLHLRGNIEGYVQAGTDQKWLEVHGGEHWTEFYTAYGLALQKRFFGYFLKGEDTGWSSQPNVLLQVRTVNGFVERGEEAWPIPRTDWKKLHLSPKSLALSGNSPASVATLTYDPMGDGLTFRTTTFDHEIEITGPLALRLSVSSASQDADLFAIVKLVDPEGKEVAFKGAVDPHTPLAQGWLRCSHRKLDERRSTFYRPIHTHDELQPLIAGEVVTVDIEIWPTSIVVPKGYHIALTIQGRDFEYPGAGAAMSNMKNPMRGCGPFLHDEPTDRPANIFGAPVTLHFGPGHDAFLLVPVIPSPEAG